MENKKKEIAKGFFTLTAKAVVLNEKNEILLIKRHKDDHHGAGKWDFPGGNLEMVEDSKEGLEREIEEETGLKVELEIILGLHDFEKKYKKNFNIDGESVFVNGKGVRFLGYCKSGEINLSKEHEEYEWVPLEQAAAKFGKEDFEKDKVISIEEAQKYLEMKEATDRWKRAMADFENYKKRQAEERKEMIAFANLNLISEIIPVMDNFHASTDHIPKEQKENAWVVGIMHIQKQLEKVLEDNGVVEIPVAVRDSFNPATMEALQNADEKEGEAKNIVSKVVQKGYKMGGRVVRAARVVVE
ncbi:MAG: nucleotide exchange factor GrpE [Parcubacteria group bacterium]